MCLGGSNLLLSPSIYFFCAGFIIHVHSTEVQNNTNNDCNNHIVLLFFYHDNSQNIFMAHSCHQHAQSLTRAICHTDTRQKSILFIQEPNFNPISIGGGMGCRPSDFMESHYSMAPCSINNCLTAGVLAYDSGVSLSSSLALMYAPCMIKRSTNAVQP